MAVRCRERVRWQGKFHTVLPHPFAPTITVRGLYSSIVCKCKVTFNLAALQYEYPPAPDPN